MQNNLIILKLNMNRLSVFLIFYRTNFIFFVLLLFLTGLIGGLDIVNSILLVAILSEICSFFYWSYYRKNDFYFYYNFRFSKQKLFALSFGFTFSIAVFILIILENVFIRN